MDIYDFFWSKDVADHCKETGYEFNPVEMAAIIAASNVPILKKHRAWKHIIKHYPDMPVPVRSENKGSMSLHVYIREYIKWENKVIREYHDFGEEFIYIPNCMPDMKKAKSIDFAGDYSESFHRFVNGYRLDACQTTQQAWEALSKEWKREGLQSASIRKERLCKKTDEWSHTDIGNLAIEMHVNADGEFLSFRLYDADTEEMDDAYLLDAYFHRELINRIPVPFELGDIPEDVTDPGNWRS